MPQGDCRPLGFGLSLGVCLSLGFGLPLGVCRPLGFGLSLGVCLSLGFGLPLGVCLSLGLSARSRHPAPPVLGSATSPPRQQTRPICRHPHTGTVTQVNTATHSPSSALRECPRWFIGT